MENAGKLILNNVGSFLSKTGPLRVLVEKARRRDAKRLGDLFKDNDSGIANAALNTTHIGAMQPTFERQALL